MSEKVDGEESLDLEGQLDALLNQIESNEPGLISDQPDNESAPVQSDPPAAEQPQEYASPDQIPADQDPQESSQSLSEVLAENDESDEPNSSTLDAVLNGQDQTASPSSTTHADIADTEELDPQSQADKIYQSQQATPEALDAILKDQDSDLPTENPPLDTTLNTDPAPVDTDPPIEDETSAVAEPSTDDDPQELDSQEDLTSGLESELDELLHSIDPSEAPLDPSQDQLPDTDELKEQQELVNDPATDHELPTEEDENQQSDLDDLAKALEGLNSTEPDEILPEPPPIVDQDEQAAEPDPSQPDTPVDAEPSNEELPPSLSDQLDGLLNQVSEIQEETETAISPELHDDSDVDISASSESSDDENVVESVEEIDRLLANQAEQSVADELAQDSNYVPPKNNPQNDNQIDESLPESTQSYQDSSQPPPDPADLNEASDSASDFDADATSVQKELDLELEERASTRPISEEVPISKPETIPAWLNLLALLNRPLAGMNPVTRDMLGYIALLHLFTGTALVLAKALGIL